jgi:triacylglycerol lipase
MLGGLKSCHRPASKEVPLVLTFHLEIDMNQFAKNLLVTALVAAAGTSAHATSDYAATQYPIVLAHGLAAIPFHKVAEDLKANGAEVYTTQVSAVNSSEVRGEQFIQLLQKIQAVSGAEKFNLIGHSQGNQTIRYAADALPDYIASVTSVNGVTFGSAVADTIQSLGKGANALITPIFNAFGKLVALAQGNSSLPQDAKGVLSSLTRASAAAFNQRHPAGVPSAPGLQGDPEVNGILYFSWSGVGQVTNPADLGDYLLAITGSAFKKAPNDGLVAAADSHLGLVIRDNYPMNHLDAINQLNGLVGKQDPLALYRQQANRLKNLGL